MNKIAKILIVALASVSVFASMASAENLEELGLSKIKKSRADQLYLQLDKDFSKYDKVMVLDMDMSNVQIKQASRSKVQPDDWELDEKRQGKALQMYRKAFEREFAENSQLELVEQAGENVLVVVAKLEAIAPAANSDLGSYPGRARVYSDGSGSAVLSLYLLDGESGEVLAIASDARKLGQMWVKNNSVSNGSNVQMAFNHWAKNANRALEDLPALVAGAEARF